MIESIEVLTICWTTFWAYVAIKRLIAGTRASILFVYLIFYVFYTVPLILDLTLGLPEYPQQPAFYDASRDATVRILYCIFINFLPAFWLRKERRSVRVVSASSGTPPSSVLSGVFLLGTFAPIFLVFFAPQPHVYVQYGFIISDDIALPVLVFHQAINAATMLAVFFAAGFVACAVKPKRALLYVSPLVVASAWLNGKRNIVALAVVLLIAALWYRRELNGKRLIQALCLSALFLATFSYEYQSHLRDKSIQSSSSDELYENFRMDYSRDSRLKMALYAELHPSRLQILEYRGESILFDLVFWAPRSMWPDKPYPYAVYFTPAMLGQKVSLLGWGMTTSILDEAVANASWFGLILGPLFMFWICKIGDSCKDGTVNLLTVLIASLFLAVQLPAFMVLFVAWLALLLRAQNKQKRRGPRFILEGRVRGHGEWNWALKALR